MTVLVVYASKRGSTAETIAATLRREGQGVCLEKVEDVQTLDTYDAVVIGSAVYMKRWRGDARHFLKKHWKALKQKPFWVFSSRPVGDPSDDNPDWAEPPKIAAKVEEQRARSLRRLPATEPKNFMDRAMVEGIHSEFRDRRDWTEIRDWAHKVTGDLSAVQA
jgi:menaquinone-dependent protoporphyrinogen oxidase